MELLGTLAAVLSSACGGTSIGATRYLVGAADPLLIGVFRFGIGAFATVLVAFLTGERWPTLRDYPLTVLLGLLFFGAFPVLFNASLAYTTAARGALALSTLPLLTMGVAALLGLEPLGVRKTVGVTVAVGGVAISLGLDLAAAPPDAWRGDALMIVGALCMAFYTSLSQPVIRRSHPLTFTSVGMIVGALALAAGAVVHGSFGVVSRLSGLQWGALAYLGFVGGALTFYLWSLALRYATPTRVAVSVTVNPIVAALFGATLLGEPLRPSLLFGMAGVAVGIWIAVTDRWNSTRLRPR
jgi:drug/metabolite transporter (DMT)-like permease